MPIKDEDKQRKYQRDDARRHMKRLEDLHIPKIIDLKNSTVTDYVECCQCGKWIPNLISGTERITMGISKRLSWRQEGLLEKTQ